MFSAGGLSGVAYAEISSAADYAAALTAANAVIGAGPVEAVSVQVGTGVYVFIDTDGVVGADAVVFLANTNLLQISEVDLRTV